MILASNGIIAGRGVIPSTLLTNLYAVYKAENNANDSFGLNNGTSQGGLTYSTGKSGNAFIFNGTTAYVSLPNNSLNFTGDFSVSLWLYRVSAGNYMLFNNWYNGATPYGFYVYISNGTLYFLIGNGTSTPVCNFSSTFLVNPNSWQLITVTKSLTSAKIYINGTLNNSASLSSSIAYTTTHYPSIGAAKYDAYSPAYYMENNSKIDEVNIWNKELTPTEVTELYNSGAGKFYPYTTSNLDSDAGTFITAASITDNTQKNAINQLVLDLKSANIWSKMKAIYPFVGGTASQHRFNLKDPRDLDAAYRLVFYGGGTHSANGYQPDGATAYADTRLIPSSNLNLNSVHLSAYLRTNTTGNYADMGAISSTGGVYLQLLSKWSDNKFYAQMNDNDFNDNTVTDSLGLFIGNRSSSTTAKSIKNTTTITNKTSSSISLPNNYLFLGGRSGTFGDLQSPSNREQAFASIGDGLSDSEATALYNAVQTFNTTLNRQV